MLYEIQDKISNFIIFLIFNPQFSTLIKIRAFQEIFENFDLEKSGTLTAEELHKCINQLAGYQESLIS